jgi:hypothetical protein
VATAAASLKADSPEQALALARRFYDDDQLDLMFESYDGGMPVNEIAIANHEGDDLASGTTTTSACGLLHAIC